MASASEMLSRVQDVFRDGLHLADDPLFEFRENDGRPVIAALVVQPERRNRWASFTRFAMLSTSLDSCNIGEVFSSEFPAFKYDALVDMCCRVPPGFGERWLTGLDFRLQVQYSNRLSWCFVSSWRLNAWLCAECLALSAKPGKPVPLALLRLQRRALPNALYPRRFVVTQRFTLQKPTKWQAFVIVTEQPPPFTKDPLFSGDDEFSATCVQANVQDGGIEHLHYLVEAASYFDFLTCSMPANGSTALAVSREFYPDGQLHLDAFCLLELDPLEDCWDFPLIDSLALLATECSGASPTRQWQVSGAELLATGQEGLWIVPLSDDIQDQQDAARFLSGGDPVASASTAFMTRHLHVRVVTGEAYGRALREFSIAFHFLRVFALRSDKK